MSMLPPPPPMFEPENEDQQVMPPPPMFDLGQENQEMVPIVNLPARIEEARYEEHDLINKYPFQKYFTERRNLAKQMSMSQDGGKVVQASQQAPTESARRNIWYNFALQHATAMGVKGDEQERREFARSVADEKVGLHGLEDLIRDESIMNVMVVIRDDNLQIVRVHYTDNNSVNLPIKISEDWDSFRNSLISNVITLSKKPQLKLDSANTYLQTVMPENGIRFVATLTEEGTEIVTSMRMNRVGSPTLYDLRVRGTIPSDDVYNFLLLLVASASNTLFVGPQQSGKTTMLRGYINSTPKADEILIVEDIPELDIKVGDKHDFVVAMQKTADRSMASIISSAMRYVFKRIFVGEAINAAIVDWLTASIKLRGGGCTIHADAVEGTFNAIRTLAVTELPAGVEPVPGDILMQTVADCLDAIVFLRPEPSPTDPSKSYPTLNAILAIDGDVSETAKTPKYTPLWTWDKSSEKMIWMGHLIPERLKNRFATIGVRMDNGESGPTFTVVNPAKLPPMLNHLDTRISMVQHFKETGQVQ